MIWIIFSQIGVLHHIPDPKPFVEAAFRALRPGGCFLLWLYGKEGNGFYLIFVKPLRLLTKRLPHFALSTLVRMIYWPLLFYMKLCHRLPLPLREYMLSVLKRCHPRSADLSSMTNLTLHTQSIIRDEKLRYCLSTESLKMFGPIIVMGTVGPLLARNPKIFVVSWLPYY